MGIAKSGVEPENQLYFFPASGDAFFDVHYMKSMRLEGLAKIRISEMQGFQFIEIVPTPPFGDLKEQYDAIKEKIPKEIERNSEF